MDYRSEEDFLGWASYIQFYHATDKYSQFGGDHIFVAGYAEECEDDIRFILDNIEDDNLEYMIPMKDLIKNNEYLWLASHNDPVKAMEDLMGQIREYYFNVLNGDKDGKK